MTDLVATHPKWSREEFLAFLLLYAAHIDAEYTPEEQAFIHQQIDPAHLQQVESEFKQMSDYELLQVIRAYEGNYYPSPRHKEEILNQVRALFRADGAMSIEESSLLMMLKKLL
ncbi:MAG: hypothetical protein R3301_05260 [Saprospiraceae bacterium]|nr:hypothetical protein [Saprospiraceae bacterium]